MTASRRRSRTAPAGTAVAYIRVSTDEQVASGAGLEAQRAAITIEAERRGWTTVEWHSDEGISGAKDVHQRPGLAASIAAVEQGAASAVLVAKSDRIARSLRTLLNVVDRVERAGGSVVSVDGTIDTSTAAGRFTTSVMGGVAELERALISDRTKAALAVRKAQGVRLGRPSSLSSEIVAGIAADRAAGHSYQRIADRLNNSKIATAQGGARWYPATVRKVLAGQDAARLRADLVSA